MKNSIKILGAYGAKTLNTATTCVQVDDEVLIDAGNILFGLDKDAKNIYHIFLTHTHLDHIVDIPFLIDIFFESRTKPLTIYGLKGSIENIKKHIFNWSIWPDFSNIPLTIGDEKSIIFKVLEVGEEVEVDNVKLKTIKTVHTDSSCGYVITKGGNATLFTADTYKCQAVWDEVNNNHLIKSVIIDVSFPSILKKLAFDSKHLTPELLNEELENCLLREDVTIFVNHIKPVFLDEIKDEMKTQYPNFLRGGRILNDGDILNLQTCEIKENLTKTQLDKIYIDQLIDIGYSLTSETNFEVLLEKILLGAKQLSNADGGTLYLVSEDENHLEFTVVQTDSLKIKMGGTAGKITWPNLRLYDEKGDENYEQVAALCALTGQLINIDDVYFAKDFNFEGTKKFDAGTGYRTTSMLVVPMRNHENKVIGVLQLINKKDTDGSLIAFSKEDKDFISLSSYLITLSIMTTKQNTENLQKMTNDIEHKVLLRTKTLEAIQNQLLDQVNKDPMTGLFNRRYFNEANENLVLMMKKTETPMTLIILDIDDFKIINDTYGHDAGDEVLYNIAKILKSSTRNSDICIRFGGEEFVIILPNTSIENGIKIGEKIRKTIESSDVYIDANQKINYTISLGISLVSEEEISLDAAMKRADLCLYEAKKFGKNQIQFKKES